MVHLATLGTWLSKEGVHSKDLPGGGLKAFLALHPDFARVSGAATREVVEFGDAEPPPLPQTAGPRRPSSHLAIEQSLWQAFVSDREGSAWFLDLSSLAVVQAPLTDGEPGVPVAAEPHRYIRIPTLSTTRQRDHARTFLEPHLGALAAQQLTASPTWLQRVRVELDDALLRQLLDDRRRWVVQHAREWLEEHALPANRFIYARSSSRADPSRRGRTAHLRAALHAAIDKMSEAELAALTIPARLLVD